MFAARLISRRPLSLSRPLLPCYFICRSLHWRIPRVVPIQKTSTRRYSEAAEERLRTEGVPLRNSGPTTAALLAYAAGNWAAPSVVPPGWSTDYKSWTHLLTLFAYSPYFLRLPQIEMLVNVKYGIPGEVRPLMFHPARDALVFQIDVQSEAEDGTGGGAQVHYLDCASFELWTYERGDVDTIDELVVLIGAAPTPEGVPLVRLEPDPAGEAALKRILERDESVIPLLEKEFLGYAPHATTPAEELVSADEEARTQRDKLENAIRNVRTYIKDAEEELALDAADLKQGEEGGIDPKDLAEDKRAHAEIRVAVEDAKDKLVALERMWSERYGSLQADQRDSPRELEVEPKA
ncbi:hypothetical protein FB451DRAFT_1227649 [Mycena latifolia]|nr:hypothetical protein FB451DRAFT_1227649 [Mycena latifolia]